MRALASSLLLSTLAVGVLHAQEPPRVVYRLTAQDAPPAWRVEVQISGLANPELLELRFPWDWDPEDAARISFEGAAVEPTGGGYRLRRPQADVRLAYTLPLAEPGDERHELDPLLPFRSHGSSHGFTWKVLLSLMDGEAELPVNRRLELVGEAVHASWPRQGSAWADSGGALRNGMISFGASAHALREERAGTSVEVLQFLPGPDMTPGVSSLTGELHAAYTRLLGPRADARVHVILTGGFGWNTHADTGIHMALEETAGEALTPRTAQTLAHELFHSWLGHELDSRDPDTVWFVEGFTEYMTRWTLTAIGRRPPDWFANELLDSRARTRRLEAEGRTPAFGRAGVDWRADPRLEELAYEKGALLAFHLDVALRAVGSTLPLFLRGLRQLRLVTLSDLAAALDRAGLGDFWGLHLRRAGLPSLEDALGELGYRPAPTDVPLTYLGLRVGEVDGARRVEALDPEGPAAAAGVEVGDEVLGWYPADERPGVQVALETEYPFGLTRFAIDRHEGAFLDLSRAGREVQVEIAPRLIPGGRQAGFSAAEEDVAGFFALPLD